MFIGERTFILVFKDWYELVWKFKCSQNINNLQEEFTQKMYDVPKLIGTEKWGVLDSHPLF